MIYPQFLTYDQKDTMNMCDQWLRADGLPTYTDLYKAVMATVEEKEPACSA